ncbi:MAG: GHKL domain-containing protein [Oscillospiraceae bacterium]|nr:GHKL domain-containing protein [Oscillospiraceae bacterium]
MIAALDQPYWRYVLELAMVVPASVLCLVPLRKSYAVPPLLVALVALAEEAVVVFFGAIVGLQQQLPSALILAMSVVLFFPSLMLAVQISLPKLLFCFGNAIMLSVYVNLLTTIISAPWEQDDLLTFSPRSSLLCLLFAFFLCVLFFRMLYTQMTDLFYERQLDTLWLWSIPVMTAVTVLFLWHIPLSASLAGDSELRSRLLVTLLLFPFILLVLFRLLWRFSRRLHAEADLAQENSLLQMESKRFASLSRYLNETRALRHDFRQHLRVLSGLAQSGKTEELAEYLASLEDVPVLVRYSANPTVDALIAYYAALAENQATHIDWALELPEELNMRTTDFCAILGNLVENALQAVEKLPEERRRVQVVARMLSDRMLGISVENPYTGKIRLRSDGLPAVRRTNHGVGLPSVAATVKRYGGTMDLDVSGGVFRVSILMYPNLPPAKAADTAVPEVPTPASAPEADPASEKINSTL